MQPIASPRPPPQAGETVRWDPGRDMAGVSGSAGGYRAAAAPHVEATVSLAIEGFSSQRHLPQGVTRDFAVFRPWQIADDVDVTRQHVHRQALTQSRNERFRVQLPGGLGDDEEPDLVIA